MYFLPAKAISTAYFINPVLRIANTAAFRIFRY
jgi:hypothetical protein